MSAEIVHEDVTATLKRVGHKHRDLERELKKAKGYIVFPSMGRSSLVLGGAFGRGEVFENGGKSVGFATLSQLTIGVQVGGQTFTEVVLFRDHGTFKKFREGGKITFNGNVSAVLVKAAASGTANAGGLTAHAYSQGGLLLELSMGGQKLTFVPPDKIDRAKWFGEKKQKDGEERHGLARLFGRKSEEGDEDERHAGGKEEEEKEEGEEEEGEETEERGATGEMIARHPLASMLIGPSVTFATTMLARRLLTVAASPAAQ